MRSNNEYLQFDYSLTTGNAAFAARVYLYYTVETLISRLHNSHALTSVYYTFSSPTGEVFALFLLAVPTKNDAMLCLQS